jgi:HK97 family phage major capsid protein
MSNVSIPVEKLDQISDALEAGLKFKKNALGRDEAAKIIEELVEEEMKQFRKDSATRKLSFAPGASPSDNPRSYEAMFGKSAGGLLSPDDWESFNQFAGAVARRVNDDRMNKALNEGIPSDGGFLVPTQFAAEIFNTSLESEVVRPRATVTPMTSNEKKIPGVVLGDHSSSLFGGMVGFWTPEATALAETSPQYRSIDLKAHKLAVLGKASIEWDEDSVGAGVAGLTGMVSDAISWYLDNAFLSGTGAGQPLGIMNSPCLVTVAKESAQAADTIVWQNMANMVTRLHPASLKNAIWVAHTSTLPQMLIATSGIEGAVAPKLNPDGTMTVFTRPMIFTEKMSALGDLGDLLLADFSMYGIGVRKDLRFEADRSRYFESDQIAYKGIVRVDGQPLWDDVLTLKDGTTTVSPFITLAERA